MPRGRERVCGDDHEMLPECAVTHENHETRLKVLERNQDLTVEDLADAMADRIMGRIVSQRWLLWALLALIGLIAPERLLRLLELIKAM